MRAEQHFLPHPLIHERVDALDPVPSFLVLDRGEGVAPIGYVNLVTFISTANAELREAFAEFKENGVQDVIVDLRYNGGGLVSTAIVLANLLGSGLDGETMFTAYLNPRHQPYVSQIIPSESFDPEANAVAGRIAFITTRAGASASELVANVLEPYRKVAIVGAPTYGKPVGQLPFELPSCDLELGLIAFGLRNADGDGEYFNGLPDGAGNFSGPLCEADDDLAHEMGDSLEASTAAALHFAENGECPSVPPMAALRSLPRAENPAPADPTPAQRDVAGLF